MIIALVFTLVFFGAYFYDINNRRKSTGNLTYFKTTIYFTNETLQHGFARIPMSPGMPYLKFKDENGNKSKIIPAYRLSKVTYQLDKQNTLIFVRIRYQNHHKNYTYNSSNAYWLSLLYKDDHISIYKAAKRYIMKPNGSFYYLDHNFDGPRFSYNPFYLQRKGEKIPSKIGYTPDRCEDIHTIRQTKGLQYYLAKEPELYKYLTNNTKFIDHIFNYVKVYKHYMNLKEFMNNN